ncbi:hypothetical protein QUB10_29220 [Microcoleus sp. B5-D4]
MSKEQCSKSGFNTLLRPDTTTTDPKEGVLATTRTCNGVVINNWDKEGITNVTLRHRYRNDPNQEQSRTWPSLGFGGISLTDLDIIYYTGVGTGYDYWWIQFTDSTGQVWTCKDNFYCYLTADDDGTKVLFALNGAAEQMDITMSSGGCYVSVYKQPS